MKIIQNVQLFSRVFVRVMCFFNFPRDLLSHKHSSDIKITGYHVIPCSPYLIVLRPLTLLTNSKHCKKSGRYIVLWLYLKSNLYKHVLKERYSTVLCQSQIHVHHQNLYIQKFKHPASQNKNAQTLLQLRSFCFHE